MKPSSFLWGILLMMLFGVLDSNAQANGIKLKFGKSVGVIPFEKHQNLIILKLTINGTLPLRLILDTGSQYTILTDQELTRLIDLDYGRPVRLYGSDRTKILNARLADGASLDFPALELKNQSILILDEDYLNLSNIIGTNVHGIMGTDLFKRFIVKIDYFREKLFIYEQESFDVSDEGYSKLPINIIRGKPYIQLPTTLESFNTVDPIYLLDTGASLSLVIHPNTFEGLTIPEEIVKGNIGYGLGGELRGFMGRLEEFNFPPYEFKDIVANFQDLPNFGDTIYVEPRQGFIGGELLQRFDVIFDFPGNSIYVKGNKRLKNKIRQDLSGIKTYAIGADLNEFLVRDVILSSPSYRAGLRINDQILRVNGQSVSNLSVERLSKIFSRKVGKQITLIIRRRGIRQKITFRLRAYI